MILVKGGSRKARCKHKAEAGLAAVDMADNADADV